jgi:outer membrane protein assembly factor BamB
LQDHALFYDQWGYVATNCTTCTKAELKAKSSDLGIAYATDSLIETNSGYPVLNSTLYGSQVIALHKDDGFVVWQTALSANAVSSPVAVYNEAGDAWIIQAELDGTINLLDGIDGKVIHSVKLDGEIEASPAVYGNLLVIGTAGRDKGGVYCFRIE